MNIALPKRGTPEIFYPADAAPDSASLTTAWGDTAWNQIVATTATPFVLCGAMITRVCSFTASFDEDIIIQVAIASGAAGAEVQIAAGGLGENVRYDHVVGAVARLGYTQTFDFKPVSIPIGTRLSWKPISSASVGTSISIYLYGYNPQDGFSVVSQYVNPEKYMRALGTGESFVIPSAATLTVTCDATNWVYGAWVEIHSSMPNDALITGLVNGKAGLTKYAFAQIGVGASGSEVPLAGIPLAGFTGQNGPSPGFRRFMRPVYVKKGERLSVRAKGQASSPAFEVFLVGDYLE